MKYIKLFEEFEDKSILDSDFIINTLNDIKKQAFPTSGRDGQIGFKWESKNLQLTIEVKPEEEHSRFGLSKEVSEEELKDNIPMFGEKIASILTEATKRIEEKGISLEEGDDTSHGRSGFKLLSINKFSDLYLMRYLLLVSK